MNYLKIQNLKFFFYGQKKFSIFSNICTNALITLHIIHNLKQIYQKSIIVKQIFIGQRVSIQQINPTRLGSWKFKWGGVNLTLNLILKIYLRFIRRSYNYYSINTFSTYVSLCQFIRFRKKYNNLKITTLEPVKCQWCATPGQ